MHLHTHIALVTVAALALTPCLARAQSTPADVTFEVPVNATNLSYEITKLRVRCGLGTRAGSHERFGELELPVSGGQAVTTAQVVVVMPSDAAAPGTLMHYECTLDGYSASLGWREFVSGGIGSFGIVGPRASNLIQPPTVLRGTFTW